MKVFKIRFSLPVALIFAVVYGCSGGGSSSSGNDSQTVLPPPQTCSSLTPLTSTSRIKLSVNENGIYVLSPDTFKQYPFCLDPSGITFSDFALQNFDPTLNSFVDIPLNFDQEGNIEFYGVGVNRNDYTAPNADYTETNVYWLIPATTSYPELTMAFKPPALSGVASTPAMTTLHLESNTIYWPGMINGAGMDHWFWQDITSANAFLDNFSVNNYDETVLNPQINISAYLQSYSQTASLTMGFNTASVIQPAGWSTSSPYLFTMIPTKPLINGTNVLQVSVGSPTDSVYFNWFEIEYPATALNNQIVFHGDVSTTSTYSFSINGFTENSIELFDISNPKSPLVISNGSVIQSGSGYQLTFSDTLTLSVPNNYIALAPSDRKMPANISLANGTDLTQLTGTYNYVIVSNENFLSNIQPLADFRLSQGYNVTIVKIGDVYDSYSGGIFTPQAIKDFLLSAYTALNAEYALLVGGASVDYKNYLGYGQENFVPTYLIEYSYGQTPSDYWYIQSPSCTPSLISSCAPIMAIGRLPAKTAAEADTMVNKIINYKKPASPSWNNNSIFIAANDSSAVFETDTDILISGFSTTSINISTIFDRVTSPNTTSLIIQNINNGALITNYMGHGSVGVWGGGGEGQISSVFFQASNVSSLTNINQLTFLVTLDCLNGYFAGYGEGLYNPSIGQDNPYSLSETFVKSSPAGAVAAFSPTGQGYTSNHMVLAQNLYQEILTASPGPLGLEIKQAEINDLLSSSASSIDLETVSIFVLLGDPATQLAVP